MSCAHVVADESVVKVMGAIDSACTGTVAGENVLNAYQERMHKYGLDPSDIILDFHKYRKFKFADQNTIHTSLCTATIPVRLADRVVTLKVSVVETGTPLLISVEVLRGLGMVLDFYSGECVLTRINPRLRMALPRKSNGIMLLPLLGDYPIQTKLLAKHLAHPFSKPNDGKHQVKKIAFANDEQQHTSDSHVLDKDEPSDPATQSSTSSSRISSSPSSEQDDNTRTANIVDTCQAASKCASTSLTGQNGAMAGTCLEPCRGTACSRDHRSSAPDDHGSETASNTSRPSSGAVQSSISTLDDTGQSSALPASETVSPPAVDKKKSLARGKEKGGEAGRHRQAKKKVNINSSKSDDSQKNREKESRGAPSIRPAELSSSELEGCEQGSVRSDRQVRLQPPSPGEMESRGRADVRHEGSGVDSKSPGSPQGRRARARLSATKALKKMICLSVVLVASVVGWLLPSLETAAYSSRPWLSQRQRRNLQDSLRRYRDDSELQAEYLLKARDHRPVDTSARLDLLERCARSNSVLTAATESLGGTAH